MGRSEDPKRGRKTESCSRSVRAWKPVLFQPHEYMEKLIHVQQGVALHPMGARKRPYTFNPPRPYPTMDKRRKPPKGARLPHEYLKKLIRGGMLLGDLICYPATREGHLKEALNDRRKNPHRN
jgi:hypothetical protein